MFIQDKLLKTEKSFSTLSYPITPPRASKLASVGAAGGLRRLADELRLRHVTNTDKWVVAISKYFA